MEEDEGFETYFLLKLDEFFADYLTRSRTLLNSIHKAATDLQEGKKVNFDLSVFDNVNAPAARAIPRSAPVAPVITNVTPKPKPSPSIQPTPVVNDVIPVFYSKKIDKDEVAEIQKLSTKPDISSVDISHLLPKYCKLPERFAPIIIQNLDLRTGKKFTDFWNKYILGNDPNERFFRFIVGDGRNFIRPHELIPFVSLIVESHSSLEFLKNEELFQKKFIDFIVIRAFYLMDTDFRGTVGIPQFRKMNLASVFYKADKMPDVNEAQHIFNYQHFYVTFCKFWDLDTDSDEFLSREDLFKFNESAISPLIIDRFCNANFYPRNINHDRGIDFASFAYFLMSSEDKTNLTSINFWYHLCDLDDDGVLSIKEIEELYHIQHERMSITGNETIPFEDIFRQLIDMINPEGKAFITIQDLLRSKMADVFYNTLFDLQKFLTREYQFPLINPDMDEMAKKLTQWEIYVLIEYDQLVNEGG